MTAAAALKGLNNAFIEYEGSAELLAQIATFANDAVTELSSSERRNLAPLLAAHARRLFQVDAGDDTPRPAVNPMTDRAVGGQTNPMAADLDFEYGDREVVVRATLGVLYGGAPGRAHGGMVAALFDDVTGFVLPLAGVAGYTGQLTVRYHKPVPLGIPLEFRARIESQEGRKLQVTADCHAGDERVASADALFITVDVERFGSLPTHGADRRGARALRDRGTSEDRDD